MKWFRMMIMSASLAAIMMLTMTMPIFAAANDIWFSQVKYDQNGLTFKLQSGQCLDADSTSVIVFDETDREIAGLEPIEVDNCSGNGNYTYDYESVIHVTYDPVRLDWNGTISPPIFNGMNFSESELIYYLEDFDNWEDFYANVFVSHPIIGNEYIRLTAINHIKYYEQAPYIVIDSLDELIQNSLQYTDMYDELRLIPSQEFEVKILIEVDDTLTVITPEWGKPGRIIPIQAQPTTQFEIVMPEEKDGIWEISETYIILKDEYNRLIDYYKHDYEYGYGSDIVFFPEAYNYDIIIKGYGYVGDESEEAFFLMEQDVKSQPGGKTAISFNMNDLIFVESGFEWTVDLSEYEVFESDFSLHVFALDFPNAKFEASYYETEKLYITKQDLPRITWTYRLSAAGTNNFYIYNTEIPPNGGAVKMNNQLISDMKLGRLHLSPESASDDVQIPLSFYLKDGYGNPVWVIDYEYVDTGYLVFQKKGIDEHIKGSSWIDMDWYTMYAEFPNEWDSGEPAEPGQLEGLYEVVHEMYPIPVTMKQPQYMYYLSDDALESIVAESGLTFDESIDLQKIVQSMGKQENSSFCSDDNELPKSFHIRLLMEMIDSDSLGFGTNVNFY